MQAAVSSGFRNSGISCGKKGKIMVVRQMGGFELGVVVVVNIDYCPFFSLLRSGCPQYSVFGGSCRARWQYPSEQ